MPKNLHGLRWQRSVFHSAACLPKVTWGSTLCLSLCLPGHFHLHASTIAEAGDKTCGKSQAGSWSFYLKLLHKNEAIANKSCLCLNAKRVGNAIPLFPRRQESWNHLVDYTNDCHTDSTARTKLMSTDYSLPDWNYRRHGNIPRGYVTNS